jgi:hypothetical protein
MTNVDTNKIILKNSVSEKIEPGIIINEFKSGAELEAEDIIAAKDANLKLTNGKRYTVLLSFGYLANTTKEARETAAAKNFSSKTIALALLTESLGQRLMGNFYLNVNKPNVNTRLFNSKELALVWLRQQLNENKILETDWNE